MRIAKKIVIVSGTRRMDFTPMDRILGLRSTKSSQKQSRRKMEKKRRDSFRNCTRNSRRLYTTTLTSMKLFLRLKKSRIIITSTFTRTMNITMKKRTSIMKKMIGLI